MPLLGYSSSEYKPIAITTEVAVVLANGSIAAAIMLPLIVGAFIFRSALVENNNRRQAEETQENP